MPGHSYAEIMSRPSALRKPLLYTPASSTRRPSSSPRRQQRQPLQTRVSTSTIVNSPSRLSSYYLSKAAYNTRTEEDSRGEGVVPSTVSYGDDVVDERIRSASYDHGAVDHDLHTPLPHASAPLRCPPLWSTQSNTGTSVTDSSPFPHHRPTADVNLSTPDDANMATATRQAQKKNDFGERRRLAELRTPPPSAPTATFPKSAAPPSPPATPPPSTSQIVVYTEEQRRAFESQVMQQVEALLQAQRCESRAELESYRVTAAEAQTTLKTLEMALGEQISAMQRNNGKVGGPDMAMEDYRGDCVLSSRHLSTPKERLLPSLAISVDALTFDMSRVAAAEATPATEKLLDAIMSIQDDQNVPTVLQRVIEQLFHDLARALMPPVTHFLKQQQQQQRLQDQETAVTLETRAAVDHATRNNAPQGTDELVRLQAEVAALQEEVHALRRTLRSRDLDFTSKDTSFTNGLAPFTSSIMASNTHVHPSPEDLVHVLQDRLFSECHAMLTRSRHEALLLRRSLEEEKRQHFLTRLCLLKPTHPLAPHRASVAASTASAASGHARSQNASTDLREGLGGSGGIDVFHGPHSAGGSSPVMHGSSVTRSPTSSIPDAVDSPHSHAHETGRQPTATLLGGADKAALHRWTPVRSPLLLASDSGGAGEHNREGDIGDSFPAEQPPAPRHMSSMSSQLLSTKPSGAVPDTAASLQTAMRVADEVLRTTASATHTTREPAHPYYRGERDGVTGSYQYSRGSVDVHETPQENGDATLSSRQRGERCGQPPHARTHSIAFLDPSDSFKDDVRRSAPPLFSESLTGASSRGGPSRSPSTRVVGSHDINIGTDMVPLSRSTLAMSRDGLTAAAAAAAAAENAPMPPNDTYERKVWNKAVELLSRYSIA